MKKEQAVELADKCFKELAASLEQGQTDVLEKYLGALATFHQQVADGFTGPNSANSNADHRPD